MTRRLALVLAAMSALSLFLVAGCRGPGDAPLTIEFRAAVRGADVSCEDEVAGFAFQDLRLYVYGFELLSADGSVTAVRLDDDGVWQNGELALLDFEDGSGSCRNGSAATRTVVVGKAPSGEYAGLRFRIGVPFASNHADPATARPPLNLGRMHWGWRAGYKFFRLEAAAGSGRALRLHLGSTGCTGQVGAISGCRWPNRVLAELREFDVGRDVVVFDVAPLLATLGSSTGDGSCMSEEDDPDCGNLWAVLGLDASGEAAQPAAIVGTRRGVR